MTHNIQKVVRAFPIPENTRIVWEGPWKDGLLRFLHLIEDEEDIKTPVIFYLFQSVSGDVETSGMFSYNPNLASSILLERLFTKLEETYFELIAHTRNISFKVDGMKLQ